MLVVAVVVVVVVVVGQQGYNGFNVNLFRMCLAKVRRLCVVVGRMMNIY